MDLKGRFEVTSWDEQPVREVDAHRKLTRASIGQRVHGDIDGASTSELLMYYRPDGTAAVVGLQHVAGRLLGREGTFAVESVGGFDGTTARGDLRIIEGSGTGGLSGLRGSGSTSAASDQYPYVDYVLKVELD
jgi:hypothetical protein